MDDLYSLTHGDWGSTPPLAALQTAAAVLLAPEMPRIQSGWSRGTPTGNLH